LVQPKRTLFQATDINIEVKGFDQIQKLEEKEKRNNLGRHKKKEENFNANNLSGIQNVNISEKTEKTDRNTRYIGKVKK